MHDNNRIGNLEVMIQLAHTLRLMLPHIHDTLVLFDWEQKGSLDQGKEGRRVALGEERKGRGEKIISIIVIIAIIVLINPKAS